MRVLVCSVVDLERSSNNRLHYFVRALATRHSVTVISVRDRWKAAQTKNAFSKDAEKYVQQATVRYWPGPGWPVVQELLSPLSWIFLRRRLPPMRSFDRVIVYNALLSGWVIAAAARRAGVPVIVDIADDLVGLLRNSPQLPSFIRPMAAWLGARSLKNIFRFSSRVVISASVLRERLPAHQRVETIRNGVSVDAFSKALPDSELLRPNIRQAQLITCFSGALREWVDFRPVFEAIAALKKRNQIVACVVIGREGFFDQTVRLAKKYGIESEVQFLGAVSYNRIPGLLRAGHVGLIPFAINEITTGSLPLKLFEYAATGLNIISSRLPEVQAVAGTSINYADQTEEYVAAFLHLMKNPAPVNYNFLSAAHWDDLAARFCLAVEHPTS